MTVLIETAADLVSIAISRIGRGNPVDEQLAVEVLRAANGLLGLEIRKQAAREATQV